MFFQVSPPRRNFTKKQIMKDDDTSILSLAPFSAVPKICFNNVLIGSIAIKKLCIKNPSSCIIDISVVKFPKINNGKIDVNWTETDIAAGGQTVLEIKWCPEEPLACRDTLQIFNKRSKLIHEIYVVFRAVAPVKKKSPKKPRGRVVNAQPNFIATKVRKIYSNSTKTRLSLSPKNKVLSKGKSHLRENKSTNIGIPKKLTTSVNNEVKLKKMLCKENKENQKPKVNFEVASETFDSFGVHNYNFNFHFPSPSTTMVVNRKATFDIVTRPVVKIHPTSDDDELLDDDSLEYIVKDISETKIDVTPNDTFHVRLNSESFCFTPDASRNITTKIDKQLYEAPKPNNSFELKLESSIFKLSPSTSSKSITDCLMTNKSTPINKTCDIIDTVTPNTQQQPDSFYLHQQSISPIPENNYHYASNISTRTQSNYELHYSGKEAKNVIEANLWTDKQQDNGSNGSTFIVSPKKLSTMSPKYFEISPALNLNDVRKRKSSDPLSDVCQPITKRMYSERRATSSKVDVHKLKKVLPRKCVVDEQLYKNPDPFSAAATQDPFLSNFVYYNEQWFDKQKKEFEKWLNALLTPHAELNCKTDNCKVDVVKIWEQTKNMESIVRAPTKETISSLYHTSNRLNSLRRKAFAFFNSTEIASVLSKAMNVIERKKITVRKDKDLHLDLGLQAEIMQLLLCYNPLWLRIGLESVYGETIPLKSNSDVIGLSTFLVLRFFTDPYLKQKHSIPHVRNAYLPTYAPEIKKFTLKKFIMLIYFLDQAKLKKLIPHDPCLFCTNAPIKESRKILLEFSRELLAGIGDITKYLRVAGYILTYKQTPIDEFQYAVKDLGTDLRDGVRLTRVMEVILMRNDLTKLMRYPAISRLQKIHNVKVALTALKQAGFELQGNIEPKDIVERHREKTLSLLWQIIYKFRAPIFNKAAATIQRWWKSLKTVISRRIQNKKRLAQQIKAAQIIQRYWRAYQQRQNYIKIQKCVRIIQNWFRATRAMRKQRVEYLKQLKVIQTKRQIKAASTIQSYYRSYCLMKTQRLRYLQILRAVKCIQIRLRAKILMQRVRVEYLRKRQAIIKIQRRWRATLQMKPIRNMFLLKVTSAVKIQSYFRSYRITKQQRTQYLQLRQATIVIQTRWRSTLLMKRQRSEYLRIQKSIRTIQFEWRLFLLRRKQSEYYIRRLNAAQIIQIHFRSYRQMKYQRSEYLKMKKSVEIIQNRWRATLMMRQQRKSYIKIQAATQKIQAVWRGYILRKHQNDEMNLIRERYKQASLDVQPEDTISNRFSRTLEKILNNEYKTIQCVIIAFQSLGIITKIYPVVCIDYCDRLVDKIFIIFQSTNRSVPHLEACTEGISVLINFVTYSGTRDQFLNSLDEDKIDILFNLMGMSADKEGSLFTSLCTLIWIVCHYEQQKQQIKNMYKCEEILAKIYLRSKRKQMMLEHKSNNRRRTICDYNLPVTTFCWWRNDSNVPTKFTHPLFAITKVLDILDIFIH